MPVAYDPLPEFLAECVERKLGARIQGREFYAAFAAWAKRRNVEPMSETAFGRAAGRVYARTHGHFRYYLDCQLRAAVADAA